MPTVILIVVSTIGIALCAVFFLYVIDTFIVKFRHISHWKRIFKAIRNEKHSEFEWSFGTINDNPHLDAVNIKEYVIENLIINPQKVKIYKSKCTPSIRNSNGVLLSRGGRDTELLHMTTMVDMYLRKRLYKKLHAIAKPIADVKSL